MKFAAAIGFCLVLAVSASFDDQILDDRDLAKEQQALEPSAIGYLYHQSSRKLVHPDGGAVIPNDNTKIVVHFGGGGLSRLQFRFHRDPYYGHFGYIEHVPSGKYVHPDGGSSSPPDQTDLVIHSGYHHGTLFKFDEVNQAILHIGGRYWHPNGGDLNPGDNTNIVLHQGVHGATKFYLGDANGNNISPYGPPDLGGEWSLVRAYLNPLATHTYTESFTVGVTQTKIVTTNHAWSVTAEYAKGAFSASATYSGFVERTTADTWSTSHTITNQVTVSAGTSVVIWQYIYTMDQADEQLTFRSNIFGDTNSINVKPTLSTAKVL